MARMTLKNISPVKLKGKLPGQMFTVEMADDGLPVEAYWRRRIDDDRKFNPDTPAIEIVDPPQVAPAPAPEPAPSVASPAPVAAAEGGFATNAPAAPTAATKKGR